MQDLTIIGPSDDPNALEERIALLEKQSFVFDFEVDVDDVLWSIDGGDDARAFSIDEKTGELFFESPTSYLRTYDRNGDNIYEVNILASDGESEKSKKLEVEIMDDASDNDVAIAMIKDGESLVRISSGNGWNTNISSDARFTILRGLDGESFSNHLHRRDRYTGETKLIDSTKDGKPSTGDSQHVLDLSSDGRYALLTLDEYGSVDLDGLPGVLKDEREDSKTREYPGTLYRKDLISGEVIPVATTSDGQKVEAGAGMAVMTPDAKYVAFVSDVQLAGLPRPEWGSEDWGRNSVYRKNLETGELVVVSTDVDGTLNKGQIQGEKISISADGSRIAFMYAGNDLLPEELAWKSEESESKPGVDLISRPYWSKDVLVKDLDDGVISLASTDSSGKRLEKFGHWGTGVVLSPDGNSVLFTSNGLDQGNAQLYMKDIDSGELELISRGRGLEEGNGYSDSYAASFSEDGRYIAYSSGSSNLIGSYKEGDPEWNEDLAGLNMPGDKVQWKDSNGVMDIFVHDTKTGENRRILDDIANNFDDHLRSPEISLNGDLISFSSYSQQVAPNSVGSEVYLAVNPFVNGFSESIGTGELLQLDASIVDSLSDNAVEQIAVLGSQAARAGDYRIDITAESLSQVHNLEAVEVTIQLDPKLFEAINLSDVQISSQLPIQNAIQIDNEAGTVTLSGASLSNLGQGSMISGDQALASIDLNFDNDYLETIAYNDVTGELELSPISFQMSVAEEEAIFRATLPIPLVS